MAISDDNHVDDPSGLSFNDPTTTTTTTHNDDMHDDDNNNSDPIVVHSRRDDWSFWLLGAVILLSWNVLICTLPLFQALLPPDSRTRHTLPSYITSVSTLGNLIFLGLAQRGIGKVSQSNRVETSLYLILGLTILTTFPLLSLVFPILPPVPFLILLITLTLAFSGCTAYLQSSTIAVAAMHGSKEILCVLSGQGGVAVGISGVQLYIALISVWSEHGRRVREDGTAQGREGEVETIATNDQLRSGLGLWAVSIVPIGLCILVAKRLLTLDDRKSVSVRDEGRKQRRYRLISSSADDEVEQEEHGEGEYRDDIGINSDNDEGLDYYPDRSQTRQPKEYQSSSNPSSFFSPTRLAQRILGEKTAELLIKNRVVYFSIAWVFVVTLSVFPPITTTILSVHPIETHRFLGNPQVFLAIHFFLFNVSDYIGRSYLPARPRFLITSHRKLLLASLSRTLFVPLFLGCHTVLNSESAGKKPLINSDWGYFGIIFVFGASNGYISSLGMILSSSPTLNPKIDPMEKEESGSLAGFCLSVGLVGGSIASFGVRWILKGGNPFVD